MIAYTVDKNGTVTSQSGRVVWYGSSFADGAKWARQATAQHMGIDRWFCWLINSERAVCDHPAHAQRVEFDDDGNPALICWNCGGLV